MASKNVVLVHGGFVDGSGWQGVYGPRDLCVAAKSCGKSHRKGCFGLTSAGG